MNKYFDITQGGDGELKVTPKPRKEHYQISQEKSGIYNVHFSEDKQTIEDLKKITQDLGHQVLYKGSYEYNVDIKGFEISKKKFEIIYRTVELANKTGKFDPKKLEEILGMVDKNE